MSAQIAEKLYGPDNPFSREFSICTRSGLEYPVWMCKEEEVDFATEVSESRRTGRITFEGPIAHLPPEELINGAVITCLNDGQPIQGADKYKVIENTYETNENAGCVSFLVNKIVNKAKNQNSANVKPFFSNQPRNRSERTADRGQLKRHQR